MKFTFNVYGYASIIKETKLFEKKNTLDFNDFEIKLKLNHCLATNR